MQDILEILVKFPEELENQEQARNLFIKHHVVMANKVVSKQ